ncbi:MAG TPA: prephenate dehydrogenase [Thermoguttaceae bacterium]|nr:prephenate dehydrogenase [Thermoguttaceae bacterium]
MRTFNNVAIVGVGLIGGSIGLALREKGLARHVVGIGRRQESLRTARRVGAVDQTTVSLEKGLAEAELVIVCTPVGRIVEDVRQVAKFCPEGTLISDAGSTKRSIVEQLDEGLPRGCRFLGAHPLAGREKTGAAHAMADLFCGRVTVITPTKNTQAKDYDLLEQFWVQLGSMVVQLSAEEHDRLVAITSHSPHALSVALAASLPEDCFQLVGTGLLDMTRLAAGEADIWKPIFTMNRDNVVAALDQFSRCLAALRAAIAAGDEAELERILTLAKKNRDALGS